MFNDIYKRYTKLNPDDADVKKLSSQINNELKEYSNMHRYYIFRT